MNTTEAHGEQQIPGYERPGGKNDSERGKNGNLGKVFVE